MAKCKGECLCMRLFSLRLLIGGKNLVMMVGNMMIAGVIRLMEIVEFIFICLFRSHYSQGNH